MSEKSNAKIRLIDKASRPLHKAACSALDFKCDINVGSTGCRHREIGMGEGETVCAEECGRPVVVVEREYLDLLRKGASALRPYRMKVWWDEESDAWFAQCDQLSEISAFGDTPAEAAGQLTIAMKMAVEVLEELADK